MCNGGIVATAEQPIFGVRDDRDVRIASPNPFGGSVGRGIVRQYDLNVRVVGVHD